MNLSNREYIFFALGLLAAVWFFLGYPSQDPRHIISLKSDRTTIEKHAISRFKSLGYDAGEYQVQTTFHVREKLLDSLQVELGRDKMIDYFRRNKVANIEPFYWEVQFRKISGDENDLTISSGSEDENSADSQNDKLIKLRFGTDGDFLEFINTGDQLPKKLVDRSALASMFRADKDSVVVVLSAFSDSSLAQHFLVDPQRDWHHDSLNPQQELQRLRTQLQRRRSFLLSGKDVSQMASYYLASTGWDRSELAQDSVQLGRTNGVNTVLAQFRLTQPKLNQDLYLNVKFTATGGLLGITSVYNPTGKTNDTFQELVPLIRNALIFIFCLAGIVIFFFRIRARAIDTKPALVVAIMAGIAVSLIILLSALPQLDVFSPSTNWTLTIAILIGAGIGGAGTTLAIFVFFAIGDSITRQHWSGKLSVYDYIRQGMIFNKPVGSMLVRSVFWGFTMAGFFTLLLWLFPDVYFDIRYVFQADRAAWPLLYIFMLNGWHTLMIVLGIFLVLGGQVLAMSQNKVTASIVMTLACMIVVPVPGHYGPFLNEFIIAGFIGLLMVYIYIKWDFLTLLLTHFLFLGLLLTVSGWVVMDSPDYYIFVIFMVLVAFLLVVGFLAMSRGKEEKVLSHYVPQYVEDLAQEERIKQELQIAREVQQSFLPVRTPQFDRLELAAICTPAYETGGDYYDFIPLDGNRVAVAIGDVSGKGIQAAFYMTFVKGILHTLCRESDSPAEILKKTNRLFCENAPKGIFISLVYGVIDLDNEVFHFARAGHNPILKINAVDGSVEELQPKGLGIGLTKNDAFDKNIEEVRLSLSKNDILVLYTDGIVEALNENHKFYGTHRLNNLLKKNKDHTAENVLNELSEDVQNYIGEAKQHDDMTMIIMKLKN
ncbi:MAG: PP2C family protein-serine/threonine phosphatase [Balneolaceae bacterium]